MYGYDPRFFPNMPTFNGAGRPVMIAGFFEGKGDNSTIHPMDTLTISTYSDWKAANGKLILLKISYVRPFLFLNGMVRYIQEEKS